MVVRGEVDYAGINDLSLPPLSVIGLIGIPLILLAVILEEIHTVRQPPIPSPDRAPDAGPDYFMFNGQGNNLAAYDPETGDHRIIVANHETDPDHGIDINAPICFFPDDPHRFIAGSAGWCPHPR